MDTAGDLLAWAQFVVDSSELLGDDIEDLTKYQVSNYRHYSDGY